MSTQTAAGDTILTSTPPASPRVQHQDNTGGRRLLSTQGPAPTHPLEAFGRLPLATYSRGDIGRSLLGEEQRKVAAKPAYRRSWRSSSSPRCGTASRMSARTAATSRRASPSAFRSPSTRRIGSTAAPRASAANSLDDADEVAFWLRLQKRDLPIVWTTGGREHNPDFIVVETNDAHWVVEVKMDKEMKSADVAGKRDAALRWVNASPDVAERWATCSSPRPTSRPPRAPGGR